nr:hypothetical protein [Mycoplasmopsis bovis]
MQTIPMVAATCGVSSPKQVAKARAAYDEAFKKFNDAVEVWHKRIGAKERSY